MAEYVKKGYNGLVRDEDERMRKMPEKCRDCINCCIENGRYRCASVYCIKNDNPQAQ